MCEACDQHAEQSRAAHARAAEMLRFARNDNLRGGARMPHMRFRRTSTGGPDLMV